ncbi:MAG: tetrahydromethanopterin synthesis protein [Methylobacter sp.]|nr:MAG: tetrahydromethanopterin synthesis protein [Methylobacter sp.]
MILETIVTTQNALGQPHIAPMGVHTRPDNNHDEAYDFMILPFRPSETLDNILSTHTAVINFCDDVRVFAGCLTGRRDWPVNASQKTAGCYLAAALAHTEVALVNVEDDGERPKLFCKSVYTVHHKSFKGFNRAQYSVLEAAILVSRLDRLPQEKVRQELDYLRIGVDKTAGDRELEAWQWLMAAVDAFYSGVKA